MYFGQAWLEILRDDAEAARRAAEASWRSAGSNGLLVYLALARCYRHRRAQARRSGAPSRPSFDRRWRNMPVKATNSFCRSFKGCSRKLKPRGETVDAALTGIDGALALAGETRKSTGPTPDSTNSRRNPHQTGRRRPRRAEAAFLAPSPSRTAKRPAAFELRAALYAGQALPIHRPPDRRPRRSRPALAGFSPTPEFPQIAEARRCSNHSRTPMRSRRHRLARATPASASLLRASRHVVQGLRR